MRTRPSKFADFYPKYLSQHANINCRRMHFLGSCTVLIAAIYILLVQQWRLILLLPLFGYGCAWLGHLLFEKNRPASFDNPWFSLLADWVMFKDMLLGKIKI